MKKLLSSLMAAVVVASSASTVVACGGGVNTDPITGEKIWLVTDAGKVNDKSFNQSGFEGGNHFNKEILGKNEEIGKTEPNDLAELVSAYENAKFDGAGTLILPGFHHAVEGENKAADIMNGGTTIILDSDHAGKDNQIGIMFRGDVSGFYAAMSSLITLSNKDGWDQKEVKVATFGGSHNAGAVDNFMVGYLAAIEVFNEAVKDANLKANLGIGDNVTSATRVKSQIAAPTSDSDTKWFTNSFNAGDGKTISETLTNKENDANLLMAVAGPQTKDSLDVIKTMDNKFVIGVDTDQSTMYSDYDGKIITSAEKALVDATVISLGHSKLYNEIEGVQDKTVSYATEKAASFTVENENGEFEAYDLAAKKAELWEGKTMWMGGKASVDGKNLVTGDLYNKMISTITGSVMETASIELFKTIAKDGSAINVLSNATISAYADSILDDILTSE
ncbi:type 1 periplasmic-binding domain-containing protein [Spiroplasma culicicola]|uniref:Ribose/galactose ABC transporter substrate-binding protein n=1 Tax=Spiroplasma culicicola AES-1 TaxID=1276246 RepID=W6A5M9_9MOLU|nr:hypothetical protein [Spiroplasma culicicola]AHI52438.1 ribose/galactose ABC transporter substrate-binding protein [Spiroplasma culicicola AES-1]